MSGWCQAGSRPGDPWPDGSDTVRPTADTMPSVALLARPSGVPIARTMSPTSSLAESPRTAGRRPGRVRDLDHGQVIGCVPADQGRRPGRRLNSTTAPGTAWPSRPRARWSRCRQTESNTTPEPRPLLVRISTTDGSIRLMTLTNTCCRPAADRGAAAPALGAADRDELAAGPGEPVQPASARTAAAGNAASGEMSAAGRRRVLPAAEALPWPANMVATSPCSLAPHRIPPGTCSCYHGGYHLEVIL